MACPACGGTQSIPVAPGYAECTSGVVYRQFELPRPCGRRYHVGQPPGAAPAAVCGCGTFAIGLCGECGSAVCGDHSVLNQGRRVCAYHVQDRQVAAAQQQFASQAQAGAKGRADMDRFFAAMRAAGNPGLIKIWEEDPVTIKHGKRFTKPRWDAWLLDMVYYDTYAGDMQVRGGTRLAVCPDGTWLDAGAGTYSMNRWVAREAEDNKPAYTISRFLRWSITYTEAAEMLKKYAATVGLRIG